MINNLNLILTQSSSHTESPIYVVYSKKPIVVNENYDYDEVVYMREECELDLKEFEKLEDQYNLAQEELYDRTSDCDDNPLTNKFPKDPFNVDEMFDPSDWDRLCIKMIDYFEQAFFIRENAQRFLENQSHNLNNAYIYVESAYRNPEWQQIRELLVDKALIESQDVTAWNWKTS